MTQFYKWIGFEKYSTGRFLFSVLFYYQILYFVVGGTVQGAEKDQSVFAITLCPEYFHSNWNHWG